MHQGEHRANAWAVLWAVPSVQNAHGQVVITPSFGLASFGLRGWRWFFKPITENNKVVK